MRTSFITAAYLCKLPLDMWRSFAEILGPARRGNRCGTSPETHTGGGEMIS